MFQKHKINIKVNRILIILTMWFCCCFSIQLFATESDSSLDSDGDGYLNTEEAAFGSLETDSNSGIKIDFSDAVDEQIGTNSDLDSVEANLKLWLDATNINGLSNSGISNIDTISRWIDLSGNGHVASQNVANQEPMFSSNSGGELYFNDDFFNVASFPIDDGLTEGEIFVITKTDSTNNGHFHYWGGTTQNGHFPYNNTNIYESFGIHSRYHFMPTQPLDEYFIYNLTAQNLNHSARINGEINKTETGKSMSWGNQSNLIGKSRLGSFNGYIQEILFFDKVLSDDERVKVNHYLSKKWNLESRVDSDGDDSNDANDAFPLDSTESLDTDNDGIGNNTDTDDDNDGYSDTIEETQGSSATDETSTPSIDFSDIITQYIGTTTELDSVEPGLLLWFDAQNIDFQNNGTLANGNSINTWLDLSGNNYNATQTEDNGKPVYNATDKSIQFDGNNDYLTIQNTFYETSVIDNIHIFVVIEPSSNDDNQVIFSYDLSEHYRLALHDEILTQIAYNTSSSNGLVTNTYNSQKHIIHGFYEKNRSIFNKGIFVDGQLISTTNADHSDIRSNGTHKGFIGSGSQTNEVNGNTEPNYFLNGGINEIIIIEGEISSEKQAQINYYLSKKWNLESSVDSDDDGYKDTIDPNPVSGTDSTSLVTTGGIGMPTETITVQLIPTGNDIQTGLTFEITNQPSIGSAQVITDQASNSGYSLQYNPPNNVNNYALEEVSINVGIIHSNGTKGASTTIPIYFYQFEINPNGNFFIPPGFARLDETSIQVNDIIWNFNNITFNNIGNNDTIAEEINNIPNDVNNIDNNQNDTIAEEIDNIPNDVNNIGNNLPISVFNSTTNSDQLGNYPILYKIESNDYFDINPTSGEVFVKDTSFTEIDSLELMVQATATTNERIEGVYTYINIEFGLIDIGFEPDFIGEDGNLDFQKISFDIPVLEGEETYGVNFSDEQFGNFEGPIPVDDNFKDKFFNENAEAAFEDLDIDFETDVTVAEIKFSGKSDSSLGSELNTNRLNLGGSYDDEVTWTMDDANAFLKVDTACLFGTGVTFEMPQGKMEAPIFTMAQQTNNGNPPIFNLGDSAIATFETMNFGVDGNAEGDISGSLTATTVSFGSDAEMTFDIGAQVNFNSFTMSGILTMDDGALDVETYILAGNMSQSAGTTEIETLNIQEGGTYGIKSNAEVKVKTVERADLLDLSGGSISAEELNGDTTNKGSNLIVGTLTETSTAQITRVIDFNLATILRQTKVIGNYIQTTSSGSTPNLTTTVYSGNENSQLEVSQTATVGGTLTVQKSSNMVFELNQEFKIVSANSIAGTFSSLNLPTLESGQEWDTSQLYTNGTLAITSSSSDDTATTFDSTIYVYPNPAQVSKGSPTFLYQLQQDSDVKFEVYNMFGHQIYSTQFESGQNGGTLSNQVKIPLLTLNQMQIGVYFVIVHNDTTTLNKGKFTIK